MKLDLILSVIQLILKLLEAANKPGFKKFISDILDECNCGDCEEELKDKVADTRAAIDKWMDVA